MRCLLLLLTPGLEYVTEHDSAVRVSELLSLDVSSIIFPSPIYIRIHGKGDKERIVTIIEKTASHLRAYLKVFHADGKKDMSLFYTIIKGRTDRMSPGNVKGIINKYASVKNRRILICQIKSIHICFVWQGHVTSIRTVLNLNWFPEFLAIHRHRPLAYMQFPLWRWWGRQWNTVSQHFQMKSLSGETMRLNSPDFVESAEMLSSFFLVIVRKTAEYLKEWG